MTLERSYITAVVKLKLSKTEKGHFLTLTKVDFSFALCIFVHSRISSSTFMSSSSVVKCTSNAAPQINMISLYNAYQK